MKKIFLIFLVMSSATIWPSCSNGGWDSESKELFHQSCLEDAIERGLDEAKSKSVCDCRLETAQKKYPSLSDAMANVDKMMVDEDMKKCD